MNKWPDMSDLADYKYKTAWTECGLTSKKFGFCEKGVPCNDCGFVVAPKYIEQDGRCWLCHLERKADANPTMPAPKSKFVVLGASLAGSYFAWQMAKRGFEVDVYERNRDIGTWSGIINLMSSVVKCFEASGKLEELLAEHYPCTSQSLRTTRDNIIGEADLRVDASRFNLPPFLLTCNRLRLQQQIQEWARAAGARFHPEKEATAIDDQAGDGRFVKVTFKDGSTAQGDFLIGADGNRSFVRRTLFAKEGGERDPESTGHWTANCTVKGFAFPEEIGNAGFTNYFNKGGCLGLFKYVDDTFFVYVCQKGPRPVHADGVDRLTYQQELKKRIIKDFGDSDSYVKDMFEAADASTFGSFELPEVGKHLTKWTKGRVLLIGDSAHAMCNSLGLGGGTAMEDAHCAAELIELSMRSQGGGEKEAFAIKEAFQMTELRRFHRAKKMQAESFSFATISVLMAGNPLQGCIFNLIKKAMGQKEEDRDGSLDYMNNYRVCVEHRITDKK